MGENPKKCFPMGGNKGQISKLFEIQGRGQQRREMTKGNTVIYINVNNINIGTQTIPFEKSEKRGGV